MKAQNSKITGIAALALAGVLSFSVLPLTGCGGSSSSSSSASNTTNSQSANNTSSSSSNSNNAAADNSNAAEETTNSTDSNTSSSDITLDSVESQMTSAYMGTNEDTGETYYLAMNDDGSFGMLAVLNTNGDSATSASFVGEGTVTDNNYTITDYVSGDQIGFDVTDNGDGTYTLDLGDEYGKATVAQVDVSDVFNAFKTIDKYTTSVN